MARLPQPGGDSDTWGNVLNDFLGTSHNTDGTLKQNSVGAAQLKPSAVASANIADGAVTNTKLDTATQTSLGKADTALQTAPITSVVGQTGIVTGAQIAADAALTSTYALKTELNVKSYGARGDGTGDDTAAIQAAINALPADGGVVYFPTGRYVTTATLIIGSYVTLRGEGEFSSFIVLVVGGVHGIYGQDLSHASVRDLHLSGPGRTVGSPVADGIHFDLSGTGPGNATYFSVISNVYIDGFSRDGVSIQTPIISTLDHLIVYSSGRHGLNLYPGASAGDICGTSTSLTACFMDSNWAAGYHIKQMVYSSLNGCAADGNGIGYEYDTCGGISENGCGTEAARDESAHQVGYDGKSRKVVNSKMTFNSPFAIDNCGTSFWVTIGSIVTINGLVEYGPAAGAQYSLMVDSGCKATITNASHTEPMVLAPGTTTRLPDDLANAVPSYAGSGNPIITLLPALGGAGAAVTQGANTSRAGTLHVTTGAGSYGADLFRVTYPTAKPVASVVMLSPLTSGAVANLYVTASDTDGFTVTGTAVADGWLTYLAS